MSIQRSGGPTAFDRFRVRCETETTCPDCGSDCDDRWQAVTDGSRVRYRRTCTSCGAVHRRELKPGE